MTDSKYFATNKKAEIFELKAELNNEKKEKRKEAVKKVIAVMTVGKDVSAVFPDIVNCTQTDNLKLTKLVYLYLMNYAKSHFVKDCEDANHLIRALAVRTTGCIWVDKITEYLCEPLLKCLEDEDPYVRKTAAVCVAVKNNIDVFYFSCLSPLNVLFVEDGKMEHQVFLATWKNIPSENELQFQIKECHLNADTVSSKLQNNNVYTIAKRNVEGQDILYQSLKLTNGIWILAELRIQPGNPKYSLSWKCRTLEVSQYIYQVYDSILKN
uniref:Beta-adaptin appendage C-terminal subdomain domain-containing protein n=1 Tax=Nomascus leucogenys TaxID=61853 RepID=A0A2I3HGE5_NOMLE